MPTEQSAKHKAKKEKASIKTESTDLQPLSDYVDDRAELLNQIFASLKTKTIKSIAPAFLQDKSIELIQKHCLEELVGISKKRLLSIINATKCPTDTETSDSDVENIEDHISLEEISSDSEAEKAAGKNKKAKVNKKNAASVKDIAANKAPKKEVSVLELLELQARARAIRSQLALEPITKIELDSDNETGSVVATTTLSAQKPTATVTTSTIGASKPAQSNGTEKEVAIVTKVLTTTTAASASTEVRQKPIRLKRNFRQRQMDGYEEEETADGESGEQTHQSDDRPSERIDESEAQSAEKQATDSDKEIAQPSRSPSPDVITIIPSPETLLISSDSEPEDQGTSTRRQPLTNLPPMTNLPETEDEYFLRKIKEANAQAKNNKDDPLTVAETVSIVTAVTTKLKVNSSVETGKSPDGSQTHDQQDVMADDDELKEPEDGEIFGSDDDGEKSVTSVYSGCSSRTKALSPIETNDAAPAEEQKTIEEEPSDAQAEEVNLEDSGTTIDDSVCIAGKDEASVPSSSSSSKSSSLVDLAAIEIDDDEDIIDLGKDEDFEMKIGSDDEVDKTSKATDHSSDHAENVTDYRGNKEIEAESWGMRWLRGTKVTKIMATSKLANKVRSKIKKQKKELATETSEAVAAAIKAEIVEEKAKLSAEKELENEKTQLFSSCEEGSVKQYEVLKDVDK